jgi:riboflavin synthase
MFTGLIEEVGKVKTLKSNELSIYCNRILEDSKIGDSIAVNGLCLTITEINDNFIKFHTSLTTVENSRFKIGKINIGEFVNLERALLPTTRLGGHIVTGHVDGIAKIISIRKKGEDIYIEFLFPKELKSYIAAKGSVAIDGISLTISKLLTSSFIVTVIPHTFENTNLKEKRVNDFTHIEIDIFARYSYNILNTGGYKWAQ